MLPLVFRRNQTRQWFGSCLMFLGRGSRPWNSLSTVLEEDYVNLCCRQTGAKLSNIPLWFSGKNIQIIGIGIRATVKGFRFASFLTKPSFLCLHCLQIWSSFTNKFHLWSSKGVYLYVWDSVLGKWHGKGGDQTEGMKSRDVFTW